MTATYGRHTFFVTCAILVLALSIDLTSFLTKVVATLATWHGVLAVYLSWYLLLRATDFLAELLPLACFAGVFWAEILHTASQERLVVWLSGKTVQQCLIPVLLFGMLVGAFELALNIYLRPIAVMTLSADHLGTYGERFDPRPQADRQWLASGRNLIQAYVEGGSPPLLRDVKIYHMDETYALQTVFRAKLAKPINNHVWLLMDGARWASPLVATSDKTNPDNESLSTSEQEVPFVEQELDLDVAPIWVDNYRISARYLTNDTFNALGKVKFSPDAEFRTWRQARFSLSLFCAAMPIFAATLSTLLLSNEIGLSLLCFIAIAGYLANTAMKLFIMLGEHDYLAPAIAGWAVPVFLLLACALMLLMRSKIELLRTRFVGDPRSAPDPR